MSERIDLRNLAHFMALSEHASFSAAAAALGMAQSSLSYSISKLERQFGVKLTSRGPQGVELTAEGVVLAKAGPALLRSVDDLVASVRNAGDSDHVRIALAGTLSSMISVPLAETVHLENSKLRLHIAQSMSSHILEMIQDEIMDIGCVYEIPDPRSFASLPLLTEELFLITAPDSWNVEADGSTFRPIDLHEIRDLPLVLPGNPSGRRIPLIAALMENMGVRPNVVIQMDSLTSIVEMVERASAYSVLPQAAVLSQLAAGKVAIVPIRGGLKRTAYVAWKRSRPMSAAALSTVAIMFRVVDEVIRRYGLTAICHSAGDVLTASFEERSLLPRTAHGVA